MACIEEQEKEQQDDWAQWSDFDTDNSWDSSDSWDSGDSWDSSESWDSEHIEKPELFQDSEPFQDSDHKDDDRVPDAKVHDYRSADGRCLWGMFRHLNNTAGDVARIRTGHRDYREKGRVVAVNGRGRFGAWAGEECDSMTDSLEPSALPAETGDSFRLMVGVMCRNIEMVAVRNYTWDGVPVTRYEASPTSLASSPCYCPSPASPCLPDGVLNLAPCYPHLSPPLAVSYPRYLFSDPAASLPPGRTTRPTSPSRPTWVCRWPPRSGSSCPPSLSPTTPSRSSTV